MFQAAVLRPEFLAVFIRHRLEDQGPITCLSVFKNSRGLKYSASLTELGSEASKTQHLEIRCTQTHNWSRIFHSL